MDTQKLFELLYLYKEEETIENLDNIMLYYLEAADPSPDILKTIRMILTTYGVDEFIELIKEELKEKGYDIIENEDEEEDYDD